MKFTDLKKSLDDGESFSVYLIEGEDAYFRTSAVKSIKDKFIEAPEINFVSFDGETLDVSEFTASLSALPFMSKKRMTAVREFYPKADGIKGGFKDFLSAPPAESLLVVVNEKPCESLKKYPSVCVIDCQKADEVTLARWIIAYLKKRSVEISFDTAKDLAEYCKRDMTRIKNESEKLCDLVGAGGTVLKEVVCDNVYRDAEYKIYEMTEHIGKKNFDGAIAVVNDMLYKGEPPQRIMVSIYNYFRRMLFIKISGMTDGELAEYFGIAEYAVKKAREQASKIGAKALKKAIDRLAESDFSVKTGKTDEFNAMWLNIFGIMTA